MHYTYLIFEKITKRFYSASSSATSAVIDDQHAVRMLAGAQDDGAYANLLVVGGEDGGYGGQVGT